MLHRASPCLQRSSESKCLPHVLATPEDVRLLPYAFPGLKLTPPFPFPPSNEDERAGPVLGGVHFHF
jgi:hypothetical protein